jgi:hypothetical protein
MAKVDIKIDRQGLGEFLHGPEIREALRVYAIQMAARARASAPVDSGAYRNSIRVEDDTTDRAVVRVVAHDRKAIILEAKTGNLKRAMR